MTAIYDKIGQNYAHLRRPEPTIERAIQSALGDAIIIANVGAGCGSYEPPGKSVVAIEPSMTMIRQRPPGAAPVVQASAMALPFSADAFDASMAILTVHHWPDIARGLEELRRISRNRVIILTRDPTRSGFWLTDYIPEIIEENYRIYPMLQEYEGALGPIQVINVPIPYACTDGFMGAYWRRPEAYLDPRVRAAISTFAKLGGVTPALRRLDRDLRSGAWCEQYGHLMDRTKMDLGYRLIVADS